MSSQPFYLGAFGSTGLWRDDRRAGESLLLPLSKPLALLAYLELAPDCTILRDQAVDLLWSNADEERGRQSLRQSIWLLRRRLGADALTTDDRGLTLAMPLASDRQDFLTALSGSDWARAVELYRGPFLEGFAAPGAGAYELWADLQREHLAARHRGALELAAQAYLGAGRWREAREAARALRDADPHRESSWRLLLESLLAGGDRTGASAEASALERLWANRGRSPEAATQRLVAVVHNTEAVASISHQPGMVADLVGRSREFGYVLDAWAQTRAGHGQHVRIAGSAGMGKTRLLEDLRARLINVGATVLTVRANPGERHLSCAVAAELARALGALPGAKGISEGDASTLVGFVPALGSTFRAQPEIARGSETLRRRTSAMTELLAAVSEEQPIVLLLDDVHWADADSRTILSALVHRAVGRRVLAVTAERPLDAAPLIVPATHSFELEALSAEECEALMGSLATLPAEPWATGIGEALLRSTGGSPLLLLETLRLGIEKGWLLVSEEWRLVDSAGWSRALAEGSALARRVEALDADDLALLGCLAMWGLPVTEARLRAAMGRDAGLTFESLQRAGFVVSGARGWDTAHDAVAEAAVRAMGPDEVRRAHAGIGRALSEDASLSVEEFPSAASHLVLAGAEARLVPLYRRWLARARAAGVPGNDRQLARVLLGQHATEPRVQSLLRSRSLARRLRPTFTAVAGLACLAAVGAMSTGRSAPGALALTIRPLEYSPTLVPDPVIEVLDKRGRRLLDFNDTLTLSSPSPWVRLEGGTVVVASEGVARFRAVRAVSLPAPITGRTVYRVGGRGVPALEWAQPHANSGLWLEQGTVNGQVVDASRRTVRVAVGDSIRLDLRLRYTSAWPSASVVLGGTATWGDRRRSVFTIKPLLTPVDSGFQHVTVTVDGPRQAGRHAIVLFFDADENAEFIASGTNWLVKRPVWDDGNDVVDWTAAQMEEANRVGSVSIVRSYPPPVPKRDAHVPATVIYVVAEPAPIGRGD